ncbi:MAG: AAA family ATPase [Thermoplasmata archaeon]|nr:AAA family ATPase [Thermoplasmata archaeon]
MKNWLAVALLVPVLLSGVTLLVPSTEGWSGTFEDNVVLEYTPQHPIDGQSVNVTIRSKGAIISAANLNIELFYPGGDHSSGGYQFSRINATSMYVIIPGYPGGTQVRFTVTVWDEEAASITSPQYSYVVKKVGGWISENFDENLKIVWDREVAISGKPFNVTIQSLREDVPIKRAIMRFVVRFPGMESPLEGSEIFTPINETSAIYRMNGYSYGANVTWWVEAYDRYSQKIESRRYQYEIPPPSTPPPRYKVILSVYVEDVKEGKPAEGAIVTFSNETWTYTTTTTNGYAFTPLMVEEGNYRIEVKYKNSTYVKTFTVPSPTGEYLIKFKANPVTYKVGFPFKKSLSPLVLLLPILYVAGLILFPKMRSYAEEIKEKYKREKRKGNELKGREGKIVKWLLSERMSSHIRGILFFLMALLGLLWAPFYPIWLAFIMALGLGALAIRYPYLSLIITAVMVAPAASYQSVEFGWIFLVFSIIVLFLGFFDYRFSFLVFFTIFAAPYGGAYIVPLLGAVILGPVLGVSSAVVAGLFLAIMLFGSDMLSLPPLVVPEHEYSFVTFSRSAPENFTPSLWLKSLSDLSYPQTQVIGKVLSENMQATVPFLLIILWAALAYLSYRYIKGREFRNIKDAYKDVRSSAAVLLILIAFILTYFKYSGEVDILFAAYLALMALTAALPAIAYTFTKSVIPEEGEEKEEMGIKTLDEMAGFRRTSFNEVGGLQDIKEELKQAIMVPLLEPEMAEKYGVRPSKGILLFGPPGCGKTLLLRAIASELNVDMISVKCSDLMSKWYGESEAAITRLFEEARKRRPAILLLDEIDAIAKRRDFYTTDDVTPRILSLMLSELDGLEDTSGIIVVGTTNMPDLVDPALLRPGRFDKVIYVPPPSRRAREEILRIHMRGRLIGRDVDVKQLAAMTRGFSGADLENLVREAASIALARALRLRKEVPIRMKDFLEALDGLKPSITEDMMRQYEKLRREHERKKSSPRRR